MLKNKQLNSTNKLPLRTFVEINKRLRIWYHLHSFALRRLRATLTKSTIIRSQALRLKSAKSWAIRAHNPLQAVIFLFIGKKHHRPDISSLAAHNRDLRLSSIPRLDQAIIQYRQVLSNNIEENIESTKRDDRCWRTSMIHQAQEPIILISWVRRNLQQTSKSLDH
jgi:hypothetical protein